MAEITQTILASPENEAVGVYGNCLQAAVASLMDLPLDAVPHFSAFERWFSALELWAAGRDLRVRHVAIEEIPADRCIVGGRSPRGVAHACVADGGRIVWDPHPSRDGLSTVTTAFLFTPALAHQQERAAS